MLSRGSLRVPCLTPRAAHGRDEILAWCVSPGESRRAHLILRSSRLARADGGIGMRVRARCISHDVRGLPPLHRDKSLCSLACLRPPRWSTFAQTKRDILRRGDSCEKTYKKRRPRNKSSRAASDFSPQNLLKSNKNSHDPGETFFNARIYNHRGRLFLFICIYRRAGKGALGSFCMRPAA